MSTNPTASIQQKIDAIDRKWRWLKFWEYLGTTGTIFGLIWLGLEILAWRQILTTPWLFYVLVGFYILGAIVTFLAVASVALAMQVRRAWLADRVEKGCPGLLDRLNTLVFLEKWGRPVAPGLKRKIETQAAQVLEVTPVNNPLSPLRSLHRMSLFALVLVLIIAIDLHYDPFKLLFNPPSVPMASNADTPFEIVSGNANETNTNEKPWGNVHIVNPGRDVKLGKVDVLPLQIEMTASAPMQKPAWITSINGGPEVRHELPPPTEPQYAVYQPLIYLDELKVSDWDVVSYYAQVETNAPGEYASKIYFIEIRPFREDILKQTGSANGKGKNARELLNELTGLITQQTVALQQTHQFQQTSYATDKMRKEDEKKLTDLEGSLSVATNHLYGKIVAENENAPIGDLLDHLTQAQEQMDKATENLVEDVIPEAKQREQGALTELVACRKSFMKVLSQNPNAFGDGSGSSSDEGNDPAMITAQESLKSLSQVTEMHDREQAALKALHQMNQQQHFLAQMAATKTDSGGTGTAQSEKKLKDDLDHLMQSEPDLFRATDMEKASLESDMAQAIDNLNSASAYKGRHYLDHAAGDMNDLEKAAQKNHQIQQVAEAYKLKKIVDQNIQQLDKEKTKSGSLSSQDMQDVSASAERSTSALKDITDTPGSAGFGPGLSQALSPENQQALHDALDQMSKSPSGAGSQGAAGAAQGNLAKVSQAFEQGQPALSRQIQGQDQMQPGPTDAVDQATQQLQSLILSQQKKQPPSNEEQNKELGEILGNLETGLSKTNTPQAAVVMGQVQEMKKMKDGMPVDATALKKLLDEIEAMSAEANDRNQDKPPGSEITVIDSSKFPSNYRDRIKTYYEQLSTHSQ